MKNCYRTPIQLVIAMLLLFCYDGVSQCSQSGKAIWDPGYTQSDGNRGWDPWGAGHKVGKVNKDPKSDENPISLDNDDACRVGYELLLNAVCWAPTYNNKVFYFDRDSQWNNAPYTFSNYRKKRIVQEKRKHWGWKPGWLTLYWGFDWVTVYSEFGIIITDNLSSFPCDESAFTFTPTKTGIHSIYLILHGDERLAKNRIQHYSMYSQFSITVVDAPQWKTEKPNIIPQGMEIRMEDFVDTIDPDIEFYWNGSSTPFARGTSSSGTRISTGHRPLGNNRITMKRQYDNGRYEKTTVLTIIPKAPTVNFVPSQHITLPCFGERNGVIRIPPDAITSEVSSQQIRWTLYNGEVTLPCQGNSCGATVEEQTDYPVHKSQGITINNVSEGTYTLLVENPGGIDGKADSRYLIRVSQHPEIQIQNPSKTDIICRGASTGQITVNASGGNVDNEYTFSLKKGIAEVTGRAPSSARNSVTWHNLSAGDYIAGVTNGTCQTVKSMQIHLSDPAATEAAATPLPPTCFAPSNGNIRVNITSTPANNYVYFLFKGDVQTGNPSNNTPNREYTFGGLGAGRYTVIIKNFDIPGCVLKTLPVVTLNSPVSLRLSASPIDSIGCFNASTGKIDLGASGGSGRYRYTINNKGTRTTQTTGSFTGLAEGRYEVILKNSDASCTDSYTAIYTVNQNPQLSVILRTDSITCHNSGDGKIFAEASGGARSTYKHKLYKYHWELKDNANAWQNYTPALVTQDNIANLEPGTYRVVLEDGNVLGCTMTSAQEITLANPPPLTILDVKAADAVCQADGAHIDITAKGGYKNYIYSYSRNGGVYTDFTKETKLPTGSYQVKVSEKRRLAQDECSYGNNITYRVTVPEQPLDFSVSLSQSTVGNYNISCHGEDNGMITVAAAGGNGEVGTHATIHTAAYSGYRYKRSNERHNGEYQPGYTLGGLPADTYDVSVIDGRGCVVTKGVTLTHPPVLAYTGVKTNINCFGDSTGTITPGVIGGVPPYAVTINDIKRPVNETLRGLKKGEYRIHVKDTNACTVNSSVPIDFKHEAALTLSVQGKDTKCLGEKGSAELAPAGGDGNYTLLISSNNWASYKVCQRANALEAGVYHFRATDGLGCESDAPNPVVITVPPSALSFRYTLSDYSGFNISCKGGANGHAELVANGGNGEGYSGYTFALDQRDHVSNPILGNINAGNHSLKVKDARECEISREVIFSESEARLTLELASKEDVPCANSVSGRLTVLGAGGAGQPSELTYSLDNQRWQSSPVFSNLPAAAYTVRVKDINNCEQNTRVDILSGSPAIIINRLVPQDIVCLRDKAAIQVEASGGTGSLTPQYSRNAGDYVSFVSAAPLEEGDYTVRVKDNVGCFSSVSAAFHFTSPPSALTFSAVKSDYRGSAISCHGLSNGSLSIDAAGGNGATYGGYAYRLDEGDFADANNFINLPAGAHRIQVRDGRG